MSSPLTPTSEAMMQLIRFKLFGAKAKGTSYIKKKKKKKRKKKKGAVGNHSTRNDRKQNASSIQQSKRFRHRKASLVGLKGHSDDYGALDFGRARTLRNDHVHSEVSRRGSVLDIQERARRRWQHDTEHVDQSLEPFPVTRGDIGNNRSPDTKQTTPTDAASPDTNADAEPRWDPSLLGLMLRGEATVEDPDPDYTPQKKPARSPPQQSRGPELTWPTRYTRRRRPSQAWVSELRSPRSSPDKNKDANSPLNDQEELEGADDEEIDPLATSFLTRMFQRHPNPETIRTFFRQADTANHGFVPHQNFSAVLREMDPEITDAEVEDLIFSLDPYNDGRIIYEMFIKMVSSVAQQQPPETKHAAKDTASVPRESNLVAESRPQSRINRRKASMLGLKGDTELRNQLDFERVQRTVLDKPSSKLSRRGSVIDRIMSVEAHDQEEETAGGPRWDPLLLSALTGDPVGTLAGHPLSSDDIAASPQSSRKRPQSGRRRRCRPSGRLTKPTASSIAKRVSPPKKRYHRRKASLIGLKPPSDPTSHPADENPPEQTADSTLERKLADDTEARTEQSEGASESDVPSQRWDPELLKLIS